MSWLQLISAAVSCRSASGISAQSGKGQSSTGCQASQSPLAVSGVESLRRSGKQVKAGGESVDPVHEEAEEDGCGPGPGVPRRPAGIGHGAGEHAEQARAGEPGAVGLQGRPVQLLVQLPAGDAEPADRPFLVQADEQLADRFRRGRSTAGSAGAPATSAGGRLALESAD
jgi:hypothetical protein